MRTVSRATAVVSLVTLAAVLAVSTSAAGLSVAIGPWSGPAIPDGAAATAQVTIEYDCGTLLSPVHEDIALTATTDGPGSVSLSATSFALQAPIVECTPGEAANETATLTFLATRTALAGTLVSVTVTASAASAVEGLEEGDEATASATVGTYLFVTYSAVNATYEAPAGETVEVAIRVVSESNTEIMAMPTPTAPADWPRPPASSISVQSPLVDGASGEGTIRFDVDVPQEAEPGEYTLSVTLFSHSLDMPELATEPVTVPVTIQVLAPLVDPDANDSPAPAVAVLVVLLAALAATRRRNAGRRD